MNEKFKLLALEAQMGTADFDAGSYYVATPDRMQRFAELIVRECAGLLDGEWEKEILCGSDAASILKQHFGVEQ
jgi:hypothetical protein